MKIYRASSTELNEMVHPVNQDDWEELVVRLNGRPRTKRWSPIQVRIVKENHDGTKWIASPSPWLASHALVFKEDAAIKLGTFLTHAGELLPLKCAEEPLYVWQPLCVVDALDLDRSEFARFRDGRVMIIRRHVFRAEVLAGIDAFKIPDLRSSCIYFSEHAVHVMAPAVSTGIDFQVVWDSEARQPNQALQTTPVKRSVFEKTRPFEDQSRGV